MNNKLSKIYYQTLKKNHEIFQLILNENKFSLLHKKLIGQDLDNLIKTSSRYIIKNWRSGRKSCRTCFATEVIPIYPNSIIEISLLIDSIISIFDDLFDEKMTTQQKLLNISELIRILSIITNDKLTLKHKKIIANYFHKIIMIGLSEMLTIKKLNKSGNINDIVNYFIDCYNFKSMVIDIFFELPLIELKLNKNIIHKIIKLARIHRAIFLINKDFIDLEHDIRNNTITPVLFLFNLDSIQYEDFNSKIIEEYKYRLKKFKNFNGTEFYSKAIIYKLKKLIRVEIKKLNKLFLSENLT